MRLSEDFDQSPVVRRRRETAVSFLVACLISSLTGCAEHAHATFHPTDAAFTAHSQSSDPKVYVHAEDVPLVALRSVGIIEVPGNDAEAKAAAKGRELGCWAVIDHTVFDKIKRRVRIENAIRDAFDTSDLLAHSMPSPAKTVTPPRITKFDCVMTEATQAPKPLMM